MGTRSLRSSIPFELLMPGYELKSALVVVCANEVPKEYTFVCDWLFMNYCIFWLSSPLGCHDQYSATSQFSSHFQVSLPFSTLLPHMLVRSLSQVCASSDSTSRTHLRYAPYWNLTVRTGHVRRDAVEQYEEPDSDVPLPPVT